MQNWSIQTKQYFLVALGVLLLAIGAVATLYLYSHQGNALPDVLYVVDEKGKVHGPNSPPSRAAIWNLREAGLDTIAKEYPMLVLLDNRKPLDSEAPHLIMSNNLKDLPRLIEQGR